MKNLTDKSYLRVLIYSIIQWVLTGKSEGQGYGFPFDQPHVAFVKRIYAAYEYISRLQSKLLCVGMSNPKPIAKLANVLQPIVDDEFLNEALANINGNTLIFEKLRNAMRIAPKTGGRGLNSDGPDTKISTIKKRVEKYCKWLKKQNEFSKTSNHQKLIEQIERYWEKLFADPIVTETDRGKITIQPQRTNNILERFFRDFKRGNARKTGNSTMSRILQAMIADTPLVKNLENPLYVKMLLNGKKSIEELFASIDKKIVLTELKKAEKSLETIPTEIKKVIAKKNFLNTLANPSN